jgi:hypothetical protein
MRELLMACLVPKIAVYFFLLEPVVVDAHDHRISHDRDRPPKDGTHWCRDYD